MGVTEKDLVDFVYREARLLDEMRYDAWLALFTEDGYYWMPAEWRQTDPVLQPSLMYEDLFLLKVRVERLAGARTFSQKPRSRAMHVLQAPQVDEMDADANLYWTWTPFLYVETRGDEREYQSGWAKHELTEVDGALKMRLKRVELLNFDAPLPSIQLFI